MKTLKKVQWTYVYVHESIEEVLKETDDEGWYNTKAEAITFVKTFCADENIVGYLKRETECVIEPVVKEDLN